MVIERIPEDIMEQRDMDVMAEVAQILGVKRKRADWAILLRNGVRTHAVIATTADTEHRFRDQHKQVLVKLYRGDGRSEGSKEYQAYHRDYFGRVPELTGNPFLQQSVDGGSWRGIGPYAVTQFVQGEELAQVIERPGLAGATAKAVLQDILFEIWIPVWSTGLRFKDCHPGNFVLTPFGRTVMIDTEQMRKDVRELLVRDSWAQRNEHEAAGLKRLPGLVARVVSAVHPKLAKAKVLREIKAILAAVKLAPALAALGRADGSARCPGESASALLQQLRDRELIG
jgi:hypothetical protein